MADRLHLIAEIFCRPGLWDLQNEQYKTRSGIQELWKEVASSMGPNVTVDECKRKWKNLRDAYRAEIKRIDIRIERDILKCKYDPRNDYDSKWAYFEHMKFIKDIKKPRRRGNLNKNPNVSCNDNYDEDDNDIEEFSEFHNIEGIKLEPDVETNEKPYSSDEEDDASDTQVYLETEEAEKQNNSRRNSLQSSPAIKVRLLAQNFAKSQKSADVKPVPSSCKCSKRSYDQVNFLEDLENEERSLIKSARLDISQSNDVYHVGDSDYNFLVSLLPQLKKMSELQNLQFRAKMSDFMFTIMSQSVTSNVVPVADQK